MSQYGAMKGAAESLIDQINSQCSYSYAEMPISKNSLQKQNVKCNKHAPKGVAT
jgi:hypothetical protein